MGQVPGFRVIVYVSVPIALSGQKSPITLLVLVSPLIKGRDIQLGERNSVGRIGWGQKCRKPTFCDIISFLFTERHQLHPTRIGKRCFCNNFPATWPCCLNFKLSEGPCPQKTTSLSMSRELSRPRSSLQKISYALLSQPIQKFVECNTPSPQPLGPLG